MAIESTSLLSLPSEVRQQIIGNLVETGGAASIRSVFLTCKALHDDVKNLKYPMPMNSHNRDEVFVGRLRRDESNPNTLNMWVVSDNLRKGAATNAVQIAEYLVKNKLVPITAGFWMSRDSDVPLQSSVTLGVLKSIFTMRSVEANLFLR